MSAAGTRWYVRSGFDPAWLRLNPAGGIDGDAGWHAIDVSPNFFRNAAGVLPPGMVTLRTAVPARLRYHLAAMKKTPLALSAGRSGYRARYFLGTTPLGEAGLPGRSAYNLRMIATLPELDAAPAFFTVVLYSPAESFAWHEGGIRIGPATRIFAAKRNRNLIELLLIGIYLLVGLYHLLLAVWRWSDRHNFYFGVFCVCVFAYWFFRSDPSAEWLPIDGAQRTRLEFFFLYAIGPLFMQALAQLLFARLDRVAAAYGSFCAILGCVALFADFSSALVSLTIWQASAMLVIPYTIWFVARSAYGGNVDAIYLVAGVVVQLCAAVNDILVARSMLETPQVGRYTFLVFVLGIAAVLAHRFMRVHNEVEELNANLEQRVLTRTDELKRSLDDIRNLKQKQDGDYFLTSLLLKPLGGNNNRLSSVEIRIVERQYKRFSFRKRQLELGGDFSTGHTIHLRNGPCGVFLNGDAMGKSMQGAGGALVLGTVFKAILQRTLRSAEEQSKAPEFWLRDTFEELQAVFESFDGSMLVSLVVGVVEERSGMFYWINAEHPRMVLYRDGRADFLEPEPQIRKLGVQYFDDHRLQIRARRLEANDVVISGSDGRDDLLIGYDADGGRLINENEFEFLRRVEEGDGLPQGILKAMARSGGLTDDLSLVRISFREDFSLIEDDLGEAPPLTLAQSFADRLRELQTAFGADRWPAVLKLGEELDRDYGLETETLYQLAIAAQRSGSPELCAMYAGRYLLRSPDGANAAELQSLLDSARS